MKSHAKGLEVNLLMSLKEVYRLNREILKGTMQFEDYREEGPRDIRFRLDYSPLQKDPLIVRQKPQDCYFGQAKIVEFLINEEAYQSLKKDHLFESRFYGATGKLTVEVA